MTFGLAGFAVLRELLSHVLGAPDPLLRSAAQYTLTHIGLLSLACIRATDQM